MRGHYYHYIPIITIKYCRQLKDIKIYTKIQVIFVVTIDICCIGF